mgnify:CR=1 FL=1
MELILRQDVENLGFKDDVVDVKNGYGRNFLIPSGKASLATSSAKKVLAENLKQRAYKEAKLIEDANAIAETIKGYELQIGQPQVIIKEIDGTEIDKKFIKVVGGSVKRLGKYEASVRLHRAVVADITFDVVAE